MKPYLKSTLVMALVALAFPSSQALAGLVLIVNGSSGTSEPGTTSSITSNLDTLHVAVGNTVTISDNIPADLSPYAQIWDIRFSNVFALTPAERTQYVGFLSGGGGMFVMGENSGFMPRNDSVIALVSEAGGGSLGFVTPASTQDVLAPFTGPNAVSQVTYAAPGGVDSSGTGDWITAEAGGGRGTGIAWSVGDLANAPAGALTVIFDVNFMQNQYDIPNSQNLTKNLIGFVGDQVDPPNRTPDGGSTFILLGMSGLVLFRMRKLIDAKALQA